MFADIVIEPVNVHDKKLTRPLPYYLRRLGEGVRAYRSGVRNTPLTRSLERWMDYKVVLQVGNHEVPGALRAYANVIWEYVDAIDAEDELAQYRFQKVGEMWALHFAVEGVVKHIYFKNHRGFQHFARLLAAPQRAIESLELAGETDQETLALIECERQFSSAERHDAVSIQDYERTLAFLKEKQCSAKDIGDFIEMDRLDDDIDRLEHELWPGKKMGVNPNVKTLRRQKLGKSKTALVIHKTVGTAMRRAIETLIEGQMGELAQFLEMSVDPDVHGYGFAYRPIAPEPKWLL